MYYAININTKEVREGELLFLEKWAGDRIGKSVFIQRFNPTMVQLESN